LLILYNLFLNLKNKNHGKERYRIYSSWSWFKFIGSLCNRKSNQFCLEKWSIITKKNTKMATAKKKINVAEIAKLAKKIRKDGEAWTSAIKRAAIALKK
jgi:hypothetical protein